MKNLILLILIVGISQTTYAQLEYTKSEATEFVIGFEKTRLITKIDLEEDEVQVSGIDWAVLSLDHKRMFIKLMSTYQAHEESSENLLPIDIVDDRTGKKLGYYSIIRGVRIVTD